MVQNNFKIGSKLFKINEQIKAKEVRLIDEDGALIGVTPVEEAIRIAAAKELDLIEVSPDANPPVCKIANFGKMKYEFQKKASEARRKQKVVETKEVKMSLSIAKHDYEIKIKQAQKFAEKDCKVKITIRLKGREAANLSIVNDMMNNITNDIAEFAKIEYGPRLEGMQMVLIFVKKPV